MSWKPRPNSDTKQWRRPKNDYNDEDEYPNHNNNYNNRPQRSYNSHSNYQYNNHKNRNYNYNHSNYNQNTYYQNNRQYHSQNNYNRNKYNQYNQHNQQNNYNQKKYNQNNRYNRYNQQNNNYNQKNDNHNSDNQVWINKKSKNVQYCKNTGKFIIEEIPLNELTSTLQSIWDKYYTKNMQYIEKIIFLCGPPGSGKTSICNYVEQYYNLNTLNHNEYMIDVSNLLSIVMKENNRALIISKAYELLFKKILQNIKHNKIFIIDGFLRKEQHVYVTHFLQLQMKYTQFIFLVVNVDEETSVKRQLERGQKLLQLSHSNENEQTTSVKSEHKKIRLKDSDLHEWAARNRYQKYNNLLENVRYQLKYHMKVQFNIIDASKPLNNVMQCVKRQLRFQDTQNSENIQQ